MAATPLSDIVCHVDRNALDEVAPTLAGIDRGCSLTKAVFVPKDGEGNTVSHYALHCVLFRNSDFEGCLHFLKEKALLPSSGSIRVTGVGCDKYRDVIKSVLGLEPVMMNEMFANFRGVYFLLSNVEDRKSVFYPETPPDESYEVKFSAATASRIAKMNQEMSRNSGSDPNAIFPCIFIMIGSTATAFTIDTNGKCKFSGISLTAGKSLLGLGKAFVGTNDYDELMELANIGKPGNVDTTIEESIKDDPNSAYGRYSAGLPLFSFGKLADSDRALEDYDRADRAAAVVRLVVGGWVEMVVAAARYEGVNRVIFGGHGIRGEAIRKAIIARARFLSYDEALDIKFLCTGNNCAIGAMISSPEDVMKYEM